MKTKTPILLIIIFLLVVSITGCDVIRLLFHDQGQSAGIRPPETSISSIDTPGAPINQSDRTTPALTPTENPVSGPEDFPPGINPLTGLLEANADLLSLPPALISITNFPPSARKLQGGLGSAPQVYEVYIGEGMTRFLAVFYGSFPDPKALAPNQDLNVERPTGIGPIRSGRTVYESIRSRLNGFLVMASADKKVRAQLTGITNIFGSDSGDINSAMIDVSKLMQIAEGSGTISTDMLSGNTYDNRTPADGIPATRLWVFYNALDQALWEYQPELGGYYRYQDNADESGQYTLMVDAFTGQPLLYENVIVLFAKHEFLRPTLINIKLDFISQGKALLFRDGLMYKIYWTTRNGEYEQTTGLVRPIRYTNYEGDPFALKPGQSWIHLVDVNHRYWEADPARPFKPKVGSAFWAVRFFDQAINSN